MSRIIMQIAEKEQNKHILGNTVESRVDVAAVFLVEPRLDGQKSFKSASFELTNEFSVLCESFREKEDSSLVFSPLDCMLPIRDLSSLFFQVFFRSESIYENSVHAKQALANTRNFDQVTSCHDTKGLLGMKIKRIKKRRMGRNNSRRSLIPLFKLFSPVGT